MTRTSIHTATALAMAIGLMLTACGNASPDAGAPAGEQAGHHGPAATTPTAPDTDTDTDPATGTVTSSAVASTSASASSPTTSATACSLVSQQEAGVALGGDPGAGVATAANGGSSCLYGTSPELVSVNLVPSGGKADYEHTRAAAPAGIGVDVPGVGAAAFGVFRGPAGQIWFYQGDALVEVGLIDAGGSTPLEPRATALAKAAAGRV
jgi:hypothetical protein